jgi:O-antigen/teichoic acid export membrane protein
MVVIFFTILFSVLLFLFSPFLAKYYNNENMEAIFGISALCILPMTISSIHAEGLRGMKKIKQFSLLLQGTHFGLALLLLLLYSLFSTPTAQITVIVFIAAMWLNAAWSIYLFQKHSGFNKIKSEHSGFTNMKLIAWVFPMFLSGILQIVMTSTDLFILGHYVSMDKIGVYRTGLQIAGAISVALFSVNTIVAPKFAELYAKKDMQGLALVIRNTTRFMFVLALIASLIIPSLLLFFILCSILAL